MEGRYSLVILNVHPLHSLGWISEGMLKSRSLSGFGVLQVEPTDHCNLACSMCRPHAEGWTQIHGVPKGFLSPELWKRTVDTFLDDKVHFDHIIFQWLGDPLFHPELHILLNEGQRLYGQVNYLRVDSNMILLDEKRLRSILSSLQTGRVPVLMVASIDAVSLETYVNVKGFDRLQVVRQNIRRLLRLRREYDVPVNLQLQFVVQDGNHHETIDFRDYWIELLDCYGDASKWHDEIMFKRLSVDGGGPGQLRADELYQQSVLAAGISRGVQNGINICIWEEEPWQVTSETNGVFERKACPALWSTPVIRHDGRLMTCCADLQGSMEIGNLHTERFSTLWLSAAMKQRRREHLQGTFRDACEGCGGINWYTLPEHYVDWT